MKLLKLVTALVVSITLSIFMLDANAGPRVLIDASRDGGAWWFPQPFSSGEFDPDLEHQGKALADYLKSLGMEVDELPRSTPVTAELLNEYHLVVRAGFFTFTGYSPGEIAAYSQYVAGGRPLILLADFGPLPEPDLVAMHFGLDFQGSVWGWVDSFTPHPITTGILFIFYPGGSVLIGEPPPHTTELGFFDSQTAMGILPFGFGQVFFIGDTHDVVFAEQPLTENLIIYFLSIEGLMSQVLLANLDADAESGLLDKLENALRSHDDGEFRPMRNQLRAFTKQVGALQRSGRLGPEIANPLIGMALNLIAIEEVVDDSG